MEDLPEKKELSIGISKYLRNNTIEHLKAAFIHDMLEQADFEKRLEIATNTNKKSELAEIVDDLPDISELNQLKAAPAETMDIAEAKKIIRSILSESVIDGIWKPPKNMQIKNVMGSTVIDFTEARLSPGITEIDLFCVMGSIKIIVPKNIRIKMQCSTILSESKNRSLQPETENVPVVVLKGKVVLGELIIQPKKESILKKILKKFGLD